MARHPINVAFILLAVPAAVALRRSIDDGGGDSSSSGDFMDQYIMKSSGEAGTGSVWWKSGSEAGASKGTDDAADPFASTREHVTDDSEDPIARMQRRHDVAKLADFGGYSAKAPPPRVSTGLPDDSTASGAVVDVRLDSELQEAKSGEAARTSPWDALTETATDSDGDSAGHGDYMDQYIHNSDKAGSVWWTKEMARHSEGRASQSSASSTDNFEARASQESASDAAQGAVVDVKLDSELQLARGRESPDDTSEASGDFMDQYLAKAEKGATGSVWWKKGGEQAPQDQDPFAHMMRHKDEVQLDSFSNDDSREEKPAPTGAVVDVRLDSELQEFLQKRW